MSRQLALPPYHLNLWNDYQRQGCLAYLAPGDTSDEIAPLLLRCANGDDMALRRLYDLQAPRLLGLATRITASRDLAEDVLHDVFLHVWQQAARFDPDRGSGRAWLTTLVRYRALEAVRRGAREQPGHALPEPEDDQPDAFARLAASAEGRALHGCLEALGDGPRQAITLAFVAGRTHVQVAADLGWPIGTVKSTIRRSLAALKRCLEP